MKLGKLFPEKYSWPEITPGRRSRAEESPAIARSLPWPGILLFAMLAMSPRALLAQENDQTDSPLFRAAFLDGETRVGRLTTLDEKSFALESEGETEKFSLERLQQLRPASGKETEIDPVASPGLWITLVDGSRVRAGQLSTADQRAVFEITDGSKQAIAVDRLHTVRFRGDQESPPSWQEIVQGDQVDDLLVVGDPPSLDYHQGVLGEISEQIVRFQVEGETLPVPREKLYGLVFFRTDDRKNTAATAELSDVAGQRLFLKSVRLENSAFHWSTPDGLSGTTPLENVRGLDFSQGKLTYLSRLEPTAYRWTPFFTFRGEHAPADRVLNRLSEFFEPRIDAGWSAPALQLDGKTYTSGMTLQSRTRLQYELDGKFRSLKGMAGIDDRVRPLGNVELTIRGDGAPLFQETFTGTGSARPLELDLAGVDVLEILVDFGRDLGKGDHLILANVRLIE